MIRGNLWVCQNFNLQISDFQGSIAFSNLHAFSQILIECFIKHSSRSSSRWQLSDFHLSTYNRLRLQWNCNFQKLPATSQHNTFISSLSDCQTFDVRYPPTNRFNVAHMHTAYIWDNIYLYVWAYLIVNIEIKCRFWWTCALESFNSAWRKKTCWVCMHMLYKSINRLIHLFCFMSACEFSIQTQ